MTDGNNVISQRVDAMVYYEILRYQVFMQRLTPQHTSWKRCNVMCARQFLKYNTIMFT